MVTLDTSTPTKPAQGPCTPSKSRWQQGSSSGDGQTTNKKLSGANHVLAETSSPAPATGQFPPATENQCTPQRFSYRLRARRLSQLQPTRSTPASRRNRQRAPAPALHEGRTNPGSYFTVPPSTVDDDRRNASSGDDNSPASRSARRQGTSRTSRDKGLGISRLLFDAMASSLAKWREEQILIICPGSRSTMAQLGCSELTPPTNRIPTRMFRDEDEWRPYYTYKRTRVVDGEEREEWVEDVDEDKGALWPIQGTMSLLCYLDYGIPWRGISQSSRNPVNADIQAAVLSTWRHSSPSSTMFTACSPPRTTTRPSCSWLRRSGRGPTARPLLDTSLRRRGHRPSA